jgi:hypothetical protein
MDIIEATRVGDIKRVKELINKDEIYKRLMEIMHYFMRQLIIVMK